MNELALAQVLVPDYPTEEPKSTPVEVTIQKGRDVIIVGGGDFSFFPQNKEFLSPTLRNRKVINVGTPGHKDYGNVSLSMDFTTTEARVLEKFFENGLVAPRPQGNAKPHAKKKRKQQKLARRANRR